MKPPSRTLLTLEGQRPALVTLVLALRYGDEYRVDTYLLDNARPAEDEASEFERVWAEIQPGEAVTVEFAYYHGNPTEVSDVALAKIDCRHVLGARAE